MTIRYSNNNFASVHYDCKMNKQAWKLQLSFPGCKVRLYNAHNVYHQGLKDLIFITTVINSVLQ